MTKLLDIFLTIFLFAVVLKMFGLVSWSWAVILTPWIIYILILVLALACFMIVAKYTNKP